jgi:hypothetical protein
MSRRKYTTVSIHRETYDAGKRFMQEHGYPSWEALIRGTISGHRVQRDGVIEIDLVPHVRNKAESNEGTKKAEPPPRSVDIKQNPILGRQRPRRDCASLECNSCLERYLIFWNPTDPTDVIRARKILASVSWTCDDCALRTPPADQMRRSARVLNRAIRNPNRTRQPRFMILVDSTRITK